MHPVHTVVSEVPKPIGVTSRAAFDGGGIYPAAVALVMGVAREGRRMFIINCCGCAQFQLRDARLLHCSSRFNLFYLRAQFSV